LFIMKSSIIALSFVLGAGCGGSELEPRAPRGELAEEEPQTHSRSSARSNAACTRERRASSSWAVR
jgi:hypothetical protein